MWPRLWSRFGFNLAEKLWGFDENMVMIRSRFLDLVQKWSRFGRHMVEIWSRSRPSREMVEKWSSIGQDLVQIWSRSDRELIKIFCREIVEIWSRLGLDLSKIMILLYYTRSYTQFTPFLMKRTNSTMNRLKYRKIKKF